MVVLHLFHLPANNRVAVVAAEAAASGHTVNGKADRHCAKAWGRGRMMSLNLYKKWHR